MEPALTAEEWALWRYEPRADMRRQIMAWLNVPPFHHDPLTQRRDAVAALCLYGQPFGFTWQDVDALRCTAASEGVLRPGNPPTFQATAMQEFERVALESLADRIAALLPPREDTRG